MAPASAAPDQYYFYVNDTPNYAYDDSKEVEYNNVEEPVHQAVYDLEGGQQQTGKFLGYNIRNDENIQRLIDTQNAYFTDHLPEIIALIIVSVILLGLVYLVYKQKCSSAAHSDTYEVDNEQQQPPQSYHDESIIPTEYSSLKQVVVKREL